MKKFLTSLLTLVSLMLMSVPAFAETGTGGGLAAIGAGACMGLAAFGGALGQSRAAASALEGIARNPQAAGKVQTPMIIALAMIESLVLFSLVIAFTIAGKVA